MRARLNTSSAIRICEGRQIVISLRRRISSWVTRLPSDGFSTSLILTSPSSSIQEFDSGRYRFLNAGTGGWGTADYTAFYEDFGSELQADFVLVFLNTGDIGRSIKRNLYRLDEDSSPKLSRTPYTPKVRLKTAIDSLPGYQFALENSHLTQLVRAAWLAPSHKLSSDRRASFGCPHLVPAWCVKDSEITATVNLGKALFQRLARYVADNGSNLIVLTTGWHKFTGMKNYPTGEFMSSADGFFREIGVPFFDISARVFERANGDLSSFSIANDGHPNERGASAIAVEAWRILRGSRDDSTE